MAEGEVVIGEVGGGGIGAGPETGGVVVAETHDGEGGEVSSFFGFGEIAEEVFHPVDVGEVGIEAAEVGIGDGGEAFASRFGPLLFAVFGGGDEGDEPAVVADGESFFKGSVPEIAAGGVGGFSGVIDWGATEVEAEGTAPSGVEVGIELLGIVGSDGAGGPDVTVGANIAVDVKIIEQDEFAGEFEVIGSLFFAEQDEGGIPVSFAEATEDLIVGAIFFDDVDDVLDGRGLPGSRGYGVAGGDGDAVKELLIGEGVALAGQPDKSFERE